MISTQLNGLLHLAQIYSAQKRHAEALPNFEKYIALRKKEGIKDDADLVRFTINKEFAKQP